MPSVILSTNMVNTPLYIISLASNCLKVSHLRIHLPTMPCMCSNVISVANNFCDELLYFTGIWALTFNNLTNSTVMLLSPTLGSVFRLGLYFSALWCMLNSETHSNRLHHPACWPGGHTDVLDKWYIWQRQPEAGRTLVDRNNKGMWVLVVDTNIATKNKSVGNICPIIYQRIPSQIYNLTTMCGYVTFTYMQCLHTDVL